MQCTGHRLATDFGGAVKILVVEGVIFVHRLLHRVSIDGGRRRIHQPVHLVLHACLQHVEGATNIYLEGGAWVIVAVQQPQGGEMEHTIHALHCRVQNVAVQDIAADRENLDARVLERIGQVFFSPPREVVKDTDLSYIFLNQLVDRVGADKAGTTNYQ